MPAKPRMVPLLDVTRAYLDSGEIPRLRAVSNRDPGHRVDGDVVYGPETVIEEMPDAVSRRNSIVGQATEYENVLVRGEDGKDQMRRRVVRRESPVDYGPVGRYEIREYDIDGNCIDRRVIHGRESEIRRAFPDKMSKDDRTALRVAGGKVPDKIFKLA